MSFSDHKITAFTYRIADLPDQPNLPADELKARFDSSPEELRTAHNAVCDDAQTLSNKVESIITQTFEGTIDREMLSDELEADLTALETAVPLKCEAYFGTYTGTGNNMQINLGFQPKAVLVIDPLTNSNISEIVNFCGMGLQGNPVNSHILINATGFSTNQVYSDNGCLHQKDQPYIYIAFK